MGKVSRFKRNEIGDEGQYENEVGSDEGGAVRGVGMKGEGEKIMRDSEKKW